MMEPTSVVTAATCTSEIPRIMPIDVAEQVDVMRLQEESTYKCSDFFGEADCNTINNTTNRQLAPQHSVVDEKYRRKMCQWGFHLVDVCQFQRETMDIAMSLLDRFISLGCSAAQKTLQDKDLYQLAAVTGLYVAIKLNEPTDLEAAAFVEITRGKYTVEEIVEMEHTMITALHWRLNGPTRLAFALHFLALVRPQLRNNVAVAEKVMQLTHYHTELATTDYYFTTRKASTAGLACALNALEAAGLGPDILGSFMNATSRFGGMNPYSSEVKEARSRLVRAAAAIHQCHVATSSIAAQASANSAFIGTTRSSKVSCDFHADEQDEELGERTIHDKRQSSPVCVSRTALAEQ